MPERKAPSPCDEASSEMLAAEDTEAFLFEGQTYITMNEADSGGKY